MVYHADPTLISASAEADGNQPLREMDDAYLEILRMIENGTISAEEGEMLLDALGASSELGGKPANGPLTHPRATAKESEIWPSGPPAWVHQAWIYPLAGGVVLVGLAGMVTALLVQGGSRLGWLACTLPLMLLGGLAIALAWWSRTARWLHVRVHDQETRLRFSLPVPLRPVAWLARLARPVVPHMREVPLDEIILGLADVEEEGLLAVEVGEEGEEVQVYFG